MVPVDVDVDVSIDAYSGLNDNDLTGTWNNDGDSDDLNMNMDDDSDVDVDVEEGLNEPDGGESARSGSDSATSAVRNDQDDNIWIHEMMQELSNFRRGVGMGLGVAPTNVFAYQEFVNERTSSEESGPPEFPPLPSDPSDPSDPDCDPDPDQHRCTYNTENHSEEDLSHLNHQNQDSYSYDNSNPNSISNSEQRTLRRLLRVTADSLHSDWSSMTEESVSIMDMSGSSQVDMEMEMEEVDEPPVGEYARDRDYDRDRYFMSNESYLCSSDCDTVRINNSSSHMSSFEADVISTSSSYDSHLFKDAKQSCDYDVESEREV